MSEQIRALVRAELQRWPGIARLIAETGEPRFYHEIALSVQGPLRAYDYPTICQEIAAQVTASESET